MKRNKIWSEIIAIEYTLSQGYSDDVKKDENRLNHLRFLHRRNIKLIKIKSKIK